MGVLYLGEGGLSEPCEGDIQRNRREELVILDFTTILQGHGLAVSVDTSDGGTVTLFLSGQQCCHFLPNGSRAALL